MTDPHDWTHPAPPAPLDSIELTRDIVGADARDVFGLRVKGHSMIDALINDGDIVILRRVDKVEQGQMAAVYIRSQEITTLRHYFLEMAGKMGMPGRVRLQPANPTYEPIYVAADDIEIQGRVIAVIRHV
jgi:repressor LexA